MKYWTQSKRSCVTDTAQEFWINKKTNKGIVPIMRAASSSIKQILSDEPGWVESHSLQTVYKTYQFYTIWREPYARFLSAIRRELQDILDQHPGNERKAMNDTIDMWNKDPDIMLDLTHTISQKDICIGATNEGTNVKVFRFDLIDKMIGEALEYTVTLPTLNQSTEIDPIILEFISNTESKWMHNWCAKNYQTDFAIYNQLLKFNTLSFNKFN